MKCPFRPKTVKGLYDTFVTEFGDCLQSRCAMHRIVPSTIEKTNKVYYCGMAGQGAFYCSTGQIQDTIMNLDRNV